jgi:hypothetical protein
MCPNRDHLRANYFPEKCYDTKKSREGGRMEEE